MVFTGPHVPKAPHGAIEKPLQAVIYGNYITEDSDSHTDLRKPDKPKITIHVEI
jgi:hypothetical protein